ncbi:hypothetical protein LINGRAHAP2_LOCUS26772, partial [Linum grandiflorum]
MHLPPPKTSHHSWIFCDSCLNRDKLLCRGSGNPTRARVPCSMNADYCYNNIIWSNIKHIRRQDNNGAHLV